jgi:hypothetical protein
MLSRLIFLDVEVVILKILHMELIRFLILEIFCKKLENIYMLEELRCGEEAWVLYVRLCSQRYTRMR